MFMKDVGLFYMKILRNKRRVVVGGGVTLTVGYEVNDPKYFTYLNNSYIKYQKFENCVTLILEGHECSTDR